MRTRYIKFRGNRTIQISTFVIIMFLILLAPSNNFYKRLPKIFNLSIYASTSDIPKKINDVPQKKGCCSDLPKTKRRMIGTYYTTENNFKTILILNNKGPNQISITPTLHGKNGQSYTDSPIAVEGQSSLEVDLNTLVAKAGHFMRSGGVEFSYEGRLLEIGGGLKIVDEEKSLIFDEQMLEPGMKFPSSQLEAVYAIPFDSTQANVIISNTTAKAILVKGDAVFAGANGHHPIRSTLGPYETQVINLPHGLVKKSSAGAVSIEHNGSIGALLSMIHLQIPEKGYSEAINFINPVGKTLELHGAGLRLGSINGDVLNPVIVARNVSEITTTVNVKIQYTKLNGDTGSILLPQVSLSPGEIVLLDSSNAKLKNDDFDTAGLEIGYTGTPGSVVASVTSISESGNHVFTLPVKDPQSGLSSTGGYPWFIEDSYSTIVFIKNTTNKPQHFMLNIAYPGGQWGYKSKPIAAHQTLMVDIRKLRDNQEEGTDGSLIPLNATSGHISWGILGTIEKGLIGRAQTVDIMHSMSSTYECQCLCGPSWAHEARITPNSIELVEGGDSTNVSFEATYYDCYGNYRGWVTASIPEGLSLELSSDNPYIASFGGWPAKVTGNNGGETYIQASWTEQILTVNQLCVDPPPEMPVPPDCEICTSSFPIAYASSSVRVAGLRILQDGVDITGQTRNVIVGQPINLSLYTLPSGVSASNIIWEHSTRETVVGGYNSSEAKAEVLPLPDNKQTTYKFYYYKGTITGESNTITLTANVLNKTIKRVANLNVVRPDSSVTVASGNVQISDNFRPGDTYLHFGIPQVQGGTPGVTFNRISLQKPSGFSGDTHWVQTVSLSRGYSDTSREQWYVWNDSGLDTQYPYETNFYAEDSPGQILLSKIIYGWKQASVVDTFNMYLMFKPSIAGSIWVPLKKIPWEWGGFAHSTGTLTTTWILDTTHKIAPIVSNTYEFPIWSKVVKTPDFK